MFDGQIPTVIENRGVFYKQSMAAFYPTSCEVVADTVVQSTLTVSPCFLAFPRPSFPSGRTYSSLRDPSQG